MKKHYGSEDQANPASPQNLQAVWGAVEVLASLVTLMKNAAVDGRGNFASASVGHRQHPAYQSDTAVERAANAVVASVQRALGRVPWNAGSIRGFALRGQTHRLGSPAADRAALRRA